MTKPRSKPKKRGVRKPKALSHLFDYDEMYFGVRTSAGIVCFDKHWARQWAFFLSEYADWAESKRRRTRRRARRRARRTRRRTRRRESSPSNTTRIDCLRFLRRRNDRPQRSKG